MQEQTNIIPHEFMYTILKAMNIDFGEFMYNLLNDEPKEVMIYSKIYGLYRFIELKS
ncbi:hypothetical protein [Aquimarina aggregata]|uniref:hypothetical protein n=1 Tax=Aquimarina aggregata TaxID=1642818 RepID=UPI00248F56EC|nr:hypothetical protein [Aquimarina aggregata]